MLGTYLENVRRAVPLVHNITNYVTVNDVANVLLACGASPIMSDEPRDVADITAICGGLNINIGTLNERTIKGMFTAGKKANELGHPILLDPVGAGASALRTAVSLCKEIRTHAMFGSSSIFCRKSHICTNDGRPKSHSLGAIESSAVFPAKNSSSVSSGRRSSLSFIIFLNVFNSIIVQFPFALILAGLSAI